MTDCEIAQEHQTFLSEIIWGHNVRERHKSSNSSMRCHLGSGSCLVVRLASHDSLSLSLQNISSARAATAIQTKVKTYQFELSLCEGLK
eukprot:2572459-Amphidinium_carterae.1